MQTLTSATSLYFAGEGEEIKYTYTLNNPAYTPVRLNVTISLLDGETEITRSKYPDVDDTTYSATFDLNNVLYHELFKLSQGSAFSQLANNEQPIVERDEDMLMKFQCTYGYTYENSDGELVDVSVSTGNEFYAIQAGLNNVMRYYLQFNDYDNYLDWFNEDTTALKFLSWIPANMPVHPSQPLRLWFYNDSLLDDAYLYTQATFTDGSESDAIEINDMDGDVKLLEIACGPEDMQVFNIDTSKTVKSYKVWLQNSSGSVKTEVKTFVIDYTYYERNDILFFTNSLGVNEVLWCHGRRSDKLKTSGEESAAPKASNKLTSGTRRQKRGKFTWSWEMNTGYFPKSMRNYLADFLDAGEAKFPVNGYYFPVLVTADDFDWGEDDEDLFQVTFTIELAFNERYYSPIPDAMDLASELGDFYEDFNFDFF